MHVGDVEADDRDRGDRRVGGGVPQVRQPEQEARRPAASQIALVGVRVRLLIRCQNAEPGSAPSRENA